MIESKSKKYEIKTIADFGKIPVDKIKNMLIDFEIALNFYHLTLEVVKNMNGSNFNYDFNFTWIDDGKHNIKINAEMHDVDKNN